MLTTSRTLADGDVLIEMDADWAYLGIVDCQSYESFIGDWNWENLTELIVRQMNQQRVFAWGCPEGRWNVQFTRRPLMPSPIGTHEFTGYVQTTGRLCLTSLDGFSMCAQFQKYHLPLEEDWAFSVPPGRYRVTVRQLFKWNGGGQCPCDEFPDERAEGLNYLISLVPDDEGTPPHFNWVPLARGHGGSPPPVA